MTTTKLPYLLGGAGLVLVLGITSFFLKDASLPNNPKAHTSPSLTAILKNGRPDSHIAKAKWFQNVTSTPATPETQHRALIAIPDSFGFRYNHGSITKVEHSLATAVLDNDPTMEATSFRTEYSQLPGELIFAVPPNSNLSPDHWAVAVPFRGIPVIGKVTANTNAHNELLYHEERTTRTESEFIFPLTGTIAPLQPVLYSEPRASRTIIQLGLIAFQTADATYIRPYGSSGKPKLIPNKDLIPFTPHPTPFTPRESVWAFNSATGYEQATITAVLETGLLYDVNVGNKPKTSRFSSSILTHIELLKELPDTSPN